MEKDLHRIKVLRLAIAAELVLCLIALAGILCGRDRITGTGMDGSHEWVLEAAKEGYIKWVDFNVSYTALKEAYELDVSTYGKEVHLDWVELLAYLGARYGGEFDSHEKSIRKDLKSLAGKLTEEKLTMAELTKDMEYYSYYEEAYRAVLGGLVGEYEVEKTMEDGSKQWSRVYGLKAYSPIAKGFYYEHYDDFGTSRNYGYKRQHLGHDMMGQIGTPI